MTGLRRLRSLGVRGTWYVLELSVVAAGVELGIRRLPLERVAALCGVPLDQGVPVAPPARFAELDLTPQQAGRVDVMQRLLRRRPFNGTCLRRALIGGWILRRRRPVLVLGVKKQDGQVAAHAWIQVDGVRIDPEPGTAFHALRRPWEEP
ncbi:MAG: lasso peptide biosynthesis B2 protein [Propionicimonas sp.]|nr:lasso peptide biosynthesis B2 protein [Propionicimonas sp.]